MVKPSGCGPRNWKAMKRPFPGGLVVMIPGFHCCGRGTGPHRSCAAWPEKEKKVGGMRKWRLNPGIAFQGAWPREEEDAQDQSRQKFKGLIFQEERYLR